MNLVQEKIKELIEKKFGNNQSKFAKEIGVDRTHVNHFLKTGENAGKLFIGGVMKYCESNSLNYKDYIFFD